MADDWYYTKQDQRFGPVTLAALQQLQATGGLAATDLVWTEGMPEWVQAGTLPAIYPQQQDTGSPQPAAGGWPPAYAVPQPGVGSQLQYATPHAAGGYGIANYAGFWWRVLAYLLDYVFLLIPLVVIEVVKAVIVAAGDLGSGPEAILGLFGSLLNLVTGWLYYALQDSSVHQGTFGKRICGLYVTDADGGRINFGRATGRYFGMLLSWLICGIGLMMAGWTQKKQALHDMMANCLVLKR